jgi:glycyl-tRNA synthetase beta subunit
MSLNPSAYTEAVEHALHVAYIAAEAALKLVAEPANILGETLRVLQLPINAYFERVLVNAEEETLRRARLALVQRIAQLPARVADLSKLQGF